MDVAAQTLYNIIISRRLSKEDVVGGVSVAGSEQEARFQIFDNGVGLVISEGVVQLPYGSRDTINRHNWRSYFNRWESDDPKIRILVALIMLRTDWPAVTVTQGVNTTLFFNFAPDWLRPLVKTGLIERRSQELIGAVTEMLKMIFGDIDCSIKRTPFTSTLR